SADVAHLENVGDDLRPAALLEELPGDGAAGHAPRRLAVGGAAPAPVIPDPELVLPGLVRVAGAVQLLQLAVILRAGVRVPDQHADRRAGRDALEDAREDLDAVPL